MYVAPEKRRRIQREFSLYCCCCCCGGGGGGGGGSDGGDGGCGCGCRCSSRYCCLFVCFYIRINYLCSAGWIINLKTIRLEVDCDLNNRSCIDILVSWLMPKASQLYETIDQPAEHTLGYNGLTLLPISLRCMCYSYHIRANMRMRLPSRVKLGLSLFLILLLAGDVSLNPGPERPNLRLATINTRSMRDKAPALSDLVVSKDIDLLGITETYHKGNLY